MIQEYLDKSISSFKDGSTLSLTCWLNPDKNNILLKDITKIDFNSLYPNLIVKLFDAGYIPTSEAKSIEHIRYVIENRPGNKQLWLDNREFVNSYFGKVHRREPIVTHLVTNYMNLFFNSLLNEFIDSIVYIDIDCIFTTNRVDEIIEKVKELNLSFDSDTIDYFYIRSKKRYIYMDECNTLQVKGFSKSDYILRDKIVSDITSMIREDKLESIGI